MINNTEWATSTLKEAPYWREGMTPEEYELELEYYYKHMDAVQNGTYEPMWKRKNNLK